ncbi:MAG: addiction module toxin RelE [Desulfobacteraceae bacterium 4484_190.1]|nr:MAG: addiction module toxin RelE [Desulfobacteraceae bacterium 4484_190.1]
MAWQINITKTAKKQIEKIDSSVKKKILNYLKTRIATDEDPRRFGAPLCRDMAGLWKYRIGNYRIICEIQDQKVTVLVLRLGHRSKIYGGH